MSTKKPHKQEGASGSEDSKPFLADLSSQEQLNFAKEWFNESAEGERRRVMLKSMNARYGTPAMIHQIVNLVLKLENAPSRLSSHQDSACQIGQLLIDLMRRVDAPKQLRALAELVERFPPSDEVLDFDNGWWGPTWFKPTLQDGLKSVMLGAFFDLMKRSLPPFLPTIGELDSAIRDMWKWNGGDKELRDARRELGLSGLPRGKSGRPKKQRGKK